MSILKIVIIVTVTGVVLFALLLFYTLWPTIRNVSDNKALNPFLHKSLTLKRKAFLHLAEKPESAFLKNVLNEREDYPGVVIAELKPGTLIVISEFKTFKNNVSGFTELYAIGELTTPANEKIEFENDMGGLDPSLYSEKTGIELSLTLWQDSTASRILFEK